MLSLLRVERNSFLEEAHVVRGVEAVATIKGTPFKWSSLQKKNLASSFKIASRKLYKLKKRR